MGFFCANSHITLTAAHCTPGSGSSRHCLRRGNAGRRASGNWRGKGRERGRKEKRVKLKTKTIETQSKGDKK